MEGRNFDKLNEKELISVGDTYFEKKDSASLREAESYYKAALDRGNAKALYCLGKVYDETNRINDAIVLYKRAISSGVDTGLAKFKLALIYIEKMDSSLYMEIIKLLHEAYDEGCIKAARYLGVLYFKGWAGIIDINKTVFWLEKAAQNGDIISMKSLGVIYSKGKDEVGIDINSAIKWYGKAFSLGEGKGLLFLKEHSKEPLAQFYLSLGYDYIKDYKEALKWLEESASNGYAEAQYKLGTLYRAGYFELQKDDREAFSWFQKAARQGYAKGITFIGYFYYNGLGGLIKDEETALSWYRKAAEQGEVVSQFSIGYFYEYGLCGLEKDYKEALKWYKLSAKQGYDSAKNKVKYFEENNLGV